MVHLKEGHSNGDRQCCIQKWLNTQECNKHTWIQKSGYYVCNIYLFKRSCQNIMLKQELGFITSLCTTNTSVNTSMYGIPISCSNLLHSSLWSGVTFTSRFWNFSTFSGSSNNINTHTHNHFMAFLDFVQDYRGEPTPESYHQEGKTNLDLLEQETVSSSGVSTAICKSVLRPSQTTTPAPHHKDFYRPDALPAAQPTASKHWRDAFIPT